MSKEPLYYIEIVSGKKEGPFTKDELISHPIEHSTMVWSKGFETWKRLDQIEELKDVLEEIPPPLPKTSHPEQTPLPTTSKQSLKYDSDFENSYGPVFFGIVIIAITIVLYTQKPFDISDGYRDGMVVWFLLVRLIAIITLTSEAKRQNRNPLGWVLFAFFLPPISLMVISFTKRLLDPKKDPSEPINGENTFQLPKTPDISNLSNRDKDIYRDVLRELKQRRKPTSFSFNNLELLDDKDFLWKYSLLNPECITELFVKHKHVAGHFTLKERTKDIYAL